MLELKIGFCLLSLIIPPWHNTATLLPLFSCRALTIGGSLLSEDLFSPAKVFEIAKKFCENFEFRGFSWFKLIGRFLDDKNIFWKYNNL